MGKNLTAITENPCKMCLPLGVVTAFYGVGRAMNLLHGSQGCGTYIRRHMATHYNEPVDIASTSLSEEGTVFGGERNLMKGLSNLIRLYNPEIIGVSTTCLAETIGEDVGGILRKFLEANPTCGAKLISVSAPGYGGTHYEGFWKGLYAIISGLPLDASPHEGINVILGPSSPADARAIKELLIDSGLKFTLFPDISDNLDGSYNPVYSRLPLKGTPVSEIIKMAGARMTLELTVFGPAEESPGAFLEKHYGVPLLRLDPPAGLVASDAFLTKIIELGGKAPPRVLQNRGRLMDAMADAHKYSSLGKAAIFGDPDFVYAAASLASENGVETLLAATGSKNKLFEESVKNLLSLRGTPTPGSPGPRVRDSMDFADIEEEIERLGVNLMVGSSEARRIAHRRKIPLVRATFPIHDHVGGQRVRTFGYLGSTMLLDSMANKLISQEEESFRGRIRHAYLGPGNKGKLEEKGEGLSEGMNEGICEAVNEEWREGREICPPAIALEAGPESTPDLSPWGIPVPGIPQGKGLGSSSHPCFDLEASRVHARLHLPVCPGCNISCNYCSRNSDCPNESRPGVSSTLLSPQEALESFRAARRSLNSLSVVGFAGPGESLASPELTLETMRLIGKEDRDISFCLSTNGLMLPFYVAELYGLGLRHLTVTVNTLDPEIGERILGYADYFGERYGPGAAAKLLINNQLSGIKAALALGIAVKVNTVCLKGVNERGIAALSKALGALGVRLGNITPHIPVQGSVFAKLPKPSHEEIRELRWVAGAYLPQMTHCRQCRADAAGLLGEDLVIKVRRGVEGLAFGSGGEGAPDREEGAESSSLEGSLRKKPMENHLAKPAAKPKEYKIAVISKSGVMVDGHFGQAERAYIYLSDGESVRLLENRKVGEAGGGCCGGVCGASEKKKEGRIPLLVEALSDVRAVVALRIGESPRALLLKRGIRAFGAFDTADNAALSAARKLREEEAGGEGEARVKVPEEVRDRATA
jgi:nitrogenase cofactor biosynthesis protein NifB